MLKKAVEKKASIDLTSIYPWRKWFDPIPDWFRVIDKERWFRFNELELELRKKELEIDQQRIQGLKNIMK